MQSTASRPLTARGEAPRRRILNAAEIEFGEKGFHLASVSSITTRACVGQGTFYIYFRTKEDCFCTLVQEIGRALRQYTGEAVAKGQNRMDAERLGMQAFLEFTQKHPGLYRIVQESQFVDEPVFREYYEKLAAGYSKDLDRAAKAGDIRDGDGEARAWALMGIGHFLGLRYCLWRNEVPPEDVLNEVMSFVEQGIGKAGSA